MATNATKNFPPSFDESNYTWKEYKKELSMWQSITSLDKKQQGPALYLALKGKAKDVTKDVDSDKITAEDGLDTIVKALDDIFKKYENQEAYMTYKQFEEYKRPRDMKVKDYIIKFESLHSKLKSMRMDLPEGVKAYRLLQSGNMTVDETKLCLATITEFKYDDMKKQLMKICGDEVSFSSSNSGLKSTEIKEEPVFLAESTGMNDLSQKQDGCDFASENYREEAAFFSGNRGNRFQYNRGNRWNTRGSNQNYRGGRQRGGFRYRGRVNATSKNQINPNSANGEVSRCDYCGSKFHWQYNCPDMLFNTQSKRDNSNIVGMCKNHERQEINLHVHQASTEEIDGLIGETIGMAIVDSGCSKTVAGEQWLALYKETLDDDDRNKIDMVPSQQVFKFGEGNSLASEGTVKLPALIGSQHVTIETEIIDANIPMLLSKDAMKRAGTILNFITDQVEMLGEIHDLVSTTSGHYAIPLSKANSKCNDNAQNQITLISKCIKETQDNPKKIAAKLHRQFCHCSAEKLKLLVQNSKIWNDNKLLLKEIDLISQNCQVCKRYKKSPPTPIVGLPMSSTFNECVAMDIISLEGKYILHLIDMFTIYSVACVRNTKGQNAITDAIMKTWISYFGKPQKMIADNGGEFNNAAYRDMCDMFGIEMLKTAAYSPWSNGMCERHNGTLKESILKTMEETGCSIETATVWSVSAKNTLYGHSGYSANQMVFGKNPNLPSVLTDKLPAMSTEDASYTVQENLKAMRAAREACIKSESSEKIKRALTHNVQTYNDVHFENGQKVYYKRKDKRWCGPAIVIGKHGKTVMIKHGSELVRVHISRLIHINNINYDSQKSVTDISIQDKSNEAPNIHTNVVIDESDDDNEDIQITQPTIIADEINTEGAADENEELIECHDTNHTTPVEANSSSKHISMHNGEQNTSHSNQNIQANSGQSHTHTLVDENVDDTVVEHKQRKMLPGIKTHIMYKMNDSTEWKKGFVHSRAGKATGIHKTKYNIQDEDTKAITYHDFDKEVSEWLPVTSEVLLTNIDKQAKATAKSIELQNWKNNDAYVEVEDKDQYAISTKWVVTTKEMDGNFTVKARLVARGFEDIHNQGKNDSPTCAKDTMRIALTLMASKQWKCMSLDVKSAFLQSSQLERDIFLVPPKEANTNKLWKLNKAVYGLNEASRKWYHRLSEELLKLGMKKSRYDEALFYWKKNDVLEGIITIHVDDFLFGGTTQFHKDIFESIKSIFEISKISDTPLKYLGLNLTQDENKITLDQYDYIVSLQEVEIVDNKQNDRPLDKNEHRNYRGICGSLNWLSTQSRPDIAFDVAMLSAKLNAPTVKDLNFANKIIRKVKSTNVVINFYKMEDSLHLLTYCDASYANLPNGGSQGGNFLFLADSKGHLSPLSWSSKKVRRVCRSTISAETMSMLDAVDACIWISHILEEISGCKLKCTQVMTDNESLNNAVHSTTAVEEKRLRVDIAAIREDVRNRTIIVDWIPKAEQLADVLTKQGANRERLVNVLKDSFLS